MELAHIVSYLNTYLDVEHYPDASANGLQVENSESVEKIGLAVDACHEAIIKAVEHNCSMLIVHHGLMWGKELRIVDNHFQRVRALIMADMALYAVHLPLDAHPIVGHNVEIARKLGLHDIEPFAPYHGRPIGMKGLLPAPQPVNQVGVALTELFGRCCGQLEFGPESVRSLGIVAGSATEPELFKEIRRQGIDLFVTGEPKHGAYYLAQEFGLNVYYGSHYATETFGLKALGAHLEEELGIPTVFIDTPCVF